MLIYFTVLFLLSPTFCINHFFKELSSAKLKFSWGDHTMFSIFLWRLSNTECSYFISYLLTMGYMKFHPIKFHLWKMNILMKDADSGKIHTCTAEPDATEGFSTSHAICLLGSSCQLAQCSSQNGSSFANWG